MMITHYDLVKQLVKPAADIQDTLTPSKLDLVHMIMGVSGEAGELLDAIKKHVIYNKELDLVNVIEELGDIEFYLEGLRQTLGIDREQTIHANIGKLTKRYASLSYTDKQAVERADKQ